MCGGGEPSNSSKNYVNRQDCPVLSTLALHLYFSACLPGVGPHPIVAAHVLVRSDMFGLRAKGQGQDGQGQDDPSHDKTAEILLLPNLGLMCIIMYLALSRGRTLSQHDGCAKKSAKLKRREGSRDPSPLFSFAFFCC